MSVSFEFPVVYLDPDDPEDAEVTYCQGAIKPIQFDREPYEMTLEARGYSFHLIFGSQECGNFLCIPDWQFGCELADLSDKSWNMNSILFSDSKLDYEDVTAIVWGLSLAANFIKK
jgi:hypothetical protein